MINPRLTIYGQGNKRQVVKPETINLLYSIFIQSFFLYIEGAAAGLGCDGDCVSHVNASTSVTLDYDSGSNVPILLSFPNESEASGSSTVSSENPVIDHTCIDIGLLLKNGRDYLRNLSDDHKLAIINSNPHSSSSYPTTFMNGCNRKFKAEWVKVYPWLHYSQSMDGVYCKACSLFCPESAGGVRVGALVNEPFCRWTSQGSVFLRHEKNQYHISSMVKMVEFKKCLCIHPRTAQKILKAR